MARIEDLRDEAETSTMSASSLEDVRDLASAFDDKDLLAMAYLVGAIDKRQVKGAHKKRAGEAFYALVMECIKRNLPLDTVYA